MSGSVESEPNPILKCSLYQRERELAAARAALVEAGGAVEAFDAVIADMRKQETAMLAGLSQWATLVVSSFCTDNAEALAVLPTSVAQGLIVQATVAYLYGYGLMTPALPDGTDTWHPMSWTDAIPEHLRPDVTESLRGYERLLSAIDGFEDNRKR